MRVAVCLILALFLASPVRSQQVGDTVVVTVETDMRPAPTFKDTSVGRLPKGLKAEVINSEDPFLKIKTDRSEGWVLKDFVINPEVRRRFRERLAESDNDPPDYGHDSSFFSSRGLILVAFLWWIGIAALIGYAAKQKGRSPAVWGALSVVISPLLAILVLIAAGDSE